MKRILIFGCSKNAIKISQIVSEMEDFEIIGFVDNDSLKWGSEYLGKKVMSPGDMAKCCQEQNVYILIGNYHYEETYIQAVKLADAEKVYLNLNEFLVKNQGYLGDTGKDVLWQSGYGLRLTEDNDYILICNKGLPSESDLYRQAFVLQRALAYRSAGMKIDLYGVVKGVKSKEYLFSGTKIYEGDIVELRNILRQRYYKKILVHFIDEDIYRHINYVYGINMPQIMVWSHGYDILKWDRRRFNYSYADIEQNGPLYEQRWKEKAKLWREIFKKDYISCIFVSNWLKNVAEYDLNMQSSKWKIIPNYINAEIFQYTKKKAMMRTKILLIKSHKSRVYANDIAARTIMELAERPCFNYLSFSLYGDGILFDEDLGDLQNRDYKNVHIFKKYLKQEEIAKLHKSFGIFLCPTRQDTQGVSMCEAMCSGMVVVTNKVAAVSEYIDGSCGILCGDEDYKQMADAIEYLYNHPEVFLDMSQCAAQRVRRQCGYEQTIKKEIDCILEEADSE